MKKRIPIESLVRWAYRDELPKDGATSFLRPDGFGFGWGSVAKHGQYLADVQEPDIRNRFGLVPDLAAQRGPHPDAVRIWIEIQNLAGHDFDLPDDWYPLADLCPLDGKLGKSGLAATSRGLRQITTVAQDGFRRIYRSPAELIQKAAILSVPDWHGDVPTLKDLREYGSPVWFIKEMVTSETGSMEVETKNGFDRKRRMPKPGAYRKWYLDPDPADVVVARAEYQIYVSALAALYDEIKGRLDDYEPEPTDRPAWPWEDGDRPSVRVLPDLRPPIRIVREPRPIAGPPPKRGIEKRDAA